MDRFGYSPEIAGPTYNNFDDSYPPSKCKVTLKNRDLWKKFHGLETEMIITKSGRRMFPSLQISIGDLDPQAHYCIFMEMSPASRCRFKYSSAGGWAPAGSEEAQSPQRIYLHPESPAKGDYWMSQPISFGRLKLTNTPAAPAGQVVLSSMHKYQPRIIIVKTSDPRTIGWSPSTCAVFPETQFIAVTAYQNEKITQLKIDNNPFAKGFRENGQAKCKRKRTPMDDKDEEIICVTDDSIGSSSEVNNNSFNASTGSRTSLSSLDAPMCNNSSSRSRTSSEDDRVSTCSSPVSLQGIPTVRCVQTERLIGSSVPSSPSLSHNTLDLSPAASSRLSPPSKQEFLHESPYAYPPTVPTYPSSSPYYPYMTLPTSVAVPNSYSPTYYSGYSGGYGNSMWGMAPQYFYQPQRVERFHEVKKPRKLTDFSIKAIMGC